ncbi:hypothetical protein ACFWXF_36960, partial [Streptomyces sp. NPDC059076]
SVTGVRLPATLVFDHPSPQAITAYLHTTLTPQQEEASVEAILGGLEKVELTMSEVPMDIGSLKEIGTRLRRLTRSLESQQQEVMASSGLSHDLKTVSDEELFEALDVELGDNI